MWTSSFWKATAERAIKTFAQTLVASWHRRRRRRLGQMVRRAHRRRHRRRTVHHHLRRLHRTRRQRHPSLVTDNLTPTPAESSPRPTSRSGPRKTVGTADGQPHPATTTTPPARLMVTAEGVLDQARNWIGYQEEPDGDTPFSPDSGVSPAEPGAGCSASPSVAAGGTVGDGNTTIPTPTTPSPASRPSWDAALVRRTRTRQAHLLPLGCTATLCITSVHANRGTAATNSSPSKATSTTASSTPPDTLLRHPSDSAYPPTANPTTTNRAANRSSQPRWRRCHERLRWRHGSRTMVPPGGIQPRPRIQGDVILKQRPAVNVTYCTDAFIQRLAKALPVVK